MGPPLTHMSNLESCVRAGYLNHWAILTFSILDFFIWKKKIQILPYNFLIGWRYMVNKESSTIFVITFQEIKQLGSHHPCDNSDVPRIRSSQPTFWGSSQHTSSFIVTNMPKFFSIFVRFSVIIDSNKQLWKKIWYLVIHG